MWLGHLECFKNTLRIQREFISSWNVCSRLFVLNFEENNKIEEKKANISEWIKSGHFNIIFNAIQIYDQENMNGNPGKILWYFFSTLTYHMPTNQCTFFSHVWSILCKVSTFSLYAKYIKHIAIVSGFWCETRF